MNFDAIVAAFEKKFPMPVFEIDRLQARQWILRQLAKGGVGAEIGVFRGHFSELICKIVEPQKLYLIDPWTKIGPTFGWGKEYTCFDTLTTEAARDESFARASRHAGVEVVLIEDTYPACRGQLEPLDFAYLDASHKYAQTLNELRALDKQMKPEGLILGDDWHPSPSHMHYGVFLAVQQFVRESNWQILAAGPGAQWALRRAAA